MQNLDILLADLKIHIEHNYAFMTKFCKKYTCEFDVSDIAVESHNADVQKEFENADGVEIGVCESLCIYRAIAEQLPHFDRFVFHGAAVEYQNNAYVFAAPSGTGKTTHISLWKKHLGDSLSVINGDKPIIKAAQNDFTVYGTPWAGKEGLHNNIKAPLKAICFLKQGKQNKISCLDKNEALTRILKQVYIPKNKNALSQTLSLVGNIIENIPIYLLECDISDNAFETSFNVLTK